MPKPSTNLKNTQKGAMQRILLSRNNRGLLMGMIQNERKKRGKTYSSVGFFEFLVLYRFFPRVSTLSSLSPIPTLDKITRLRPILFALLRLLSSSPLFLSLLTLRSETIVPKNCNHSLPSCHMSLLAPVLGRVFGERTDHALRKARIAKQEIEIGYGMLHFERPHRDVQRGERERGIVSTER